MYCHSRINVDQSNRYTTVSRLTTGRWLHWQFIHIHSDCFFWGSCILLSCPNGMTSGWVWPVLGCKPWALSLNRRAALKSDTRNVWKATVNSQIILTAPTRLRNRARHGYSQKHCAEEVFKFCAHGIITLLRRFFHPTFTSVRKIATFILIALFAHVIVA